MANRIYRGQDMTIRAVTAKVAAALKPGSLVKYNGVQFEAHDDASKKMFVLGNLDSVGQDVETAYAVNDSGIGYDAKPSDQFQARMAAGTYAYGDPLESDNAGGLNAAGGMIVAYFEGKTGPVAAGALADVSIAAFYTPALV